MTDDEILTHASRRLAKAAGGGVTRAGAAEFLRAHPEVLANARRDVAATSPEQLAAEEDIDSPTAPPAASRGGQRATDSPERNQERIRGSTELTEVRA